jgi:outer membrane receptor for ferrienterochelin and colicin
LISTVSQLVQNGVTVSTFENINRGSTAGIEFIAVQPLSSWWKVVVNASFFNSIVNDNINNINTNNNSWTLKLNSQTQLWYNIGLQILANYNSPSYVRQGGFGMGGPGGASLSAQTRMNASYFMDLAMKKDFFKNKFTVSFRISDLFNTRRFDSQTNGEGFFVNTLRKNESRVYYLGISYRFDNGTNEEKAKQQQKLDNNTNDEDEF